MLHRYFSQSLDRLLSDDIKDDAIREVISDASLLRQFSAQLIPSLVHIILVLIQFIEANFTYSRSSGYIFTLESSLSGSFFSHLRMHCSSHGWKAGSVP